MAKSLIQTSNQTTQNVNENSIIDLGTVIRRYGCNLRLSGNGIEAVGEGYYEITAAISVSPTTPGAVTVAIYDNGVQIPGAIAYGTTAAADDVVTLPIVTTIRQGCRCQGIDSLTAVLIEGAGEVSNISVRVEKS
jgi:hypothetical protein